MSLIFNIFNIFIKQKAMFNKLRVFWVLFVWRLFGKYPTKSKGLQLGKSAAIEDVRTFKLTNIIKKLPVIPEEYDFDDGKQIPTPMFDNDKYGNCVIAGRAHQTLRFELLEQGSLIGVNAGHVNKQYFKESNGKDTGLVVLYSLRNWRNKGWTIDKGCYKYKIYAFAQIDTQNKDELKSAIYLLHGIGVGLLLPKSAQEQFGLNQKWEYVDNASTNGKGTWGGHYVYITGYDNETLTCVTWGKKQKMTWEFFMKYCDEAYAIIDNKNSFMENSNVDIPLLESYLNELKK